MDGSSVGIKRVERSGEKERERDHVMWMMKKEERKRVFDGSEDEDEDYGCWWFCSFVLSSSSWTDMSAQVVGRVCGHGLIVGFEGYS